MLGVGAKSVRTWLSVRLEKAKKRGREMHSCTHRSRFRLVSRGFGGSFAKKYTGHCIIACVLTWQRRKDSNPRDFVAPRAIEMLVRLRIPPRPDEKQKQPARMGELFLFGSGGRIRPPLRRRPGRGENVPPARFPTPLPFESSPGKQKTTAHPMGEPLFFCVSPRKSAPNHRKNA